MPGREELGKFRGHRVAVTGEYGGCGIDEDTGKLVILLNNPRINSQPFDTHMWCEMGGVHGGRPRLTFNAGDEVVAFGWVYLYAKKYNGIIESKFGINQCRAYRLEDWMNRRFHVRFVQQPKRKRRRK